MLSIEEAASRSEEAASGSEEAASRSVCGCVYILWLRSKSLGKETASEAASRSPETASRSPETASRSKEAASRSKETEMASRSRVYCEHWQPEHVLVPLWQPENVLFPPSSSFCSPLIFYSNSAEFLEAAAEEEAEFLEAA